jgi:hypothetical protein
MTWTRAMARVAIVALFATAVAGCRPGEQDRPLEFTPGAYQGPADQTLTDNQVRELQQRGNLMR